MLEIEVEDERVKGALDSAYRRLAKSARVPGFRPGKAPRPMLERYLGKDRLFHEAIDILVPEVYREAVAEEKLDPVALPDVEVVSEEPLKLKATVPVAPTVDLGDYKSVRVEREPVTVEPERVQEELERLRHRYATVEPADRPVQAGDIVRADVTAIVEGRPILAEKEAEFRVQDGSIAFLPGFPEKLVGAAKGAELDFELALSSELNDQEVAGKTCECHVVVHEVKEEKLPELDDEFARQVGEGFESLVALRDRIDSDLKGIAENEEKERYEEKVLDELVKRADLDFPPVLIERESERLLRDRFRGWQAADFERYIRQIGKTEQDLIDEVRPVAEERIKRSLVLSEVSAAENISVDNGEVQADIDRVVAAAGAQGEQMRQVFESDEGRETVRRRLLTTKTLDYLTQLASGAEPEEAKTTKVRRETPTEPESA